MARRWPLVRMTTNKLLSRGRYACRVASLFCFSLLLSACDIEPVAVGVWDVVTEAGGATEEAVWTITACPSLTIEGPRTIEAEEVELSGSRLSWSYVASAPNRDAGETRTNFNGTIDGDRLSGTLFTQFGNFTVTGERRASE